MRIIHNSTQLGISYNSSIIINININYNEYEWSQTYSDFHSTQHTEEETLKNAEVTSKNIHSTKHMCSAINWQI